MAETQSSLPSGPGASESRAVPAHWSQRRQTRAGNPKVHLVTDAESADGMAAADCQVPLRIEILGPVRVSRAGVPMALGTDRRRAVFGLLALSAGEVVSRGALTGALWDGEPPQTAVAMIHSYVSQLRTTLASGAAVHHPQGVLETVGAGYRLCLDGAELDLSQFCAQAGQARAALRAGDMVAARAAFAAALALWRGEPVADVECLRDHPIAVRLAEERADLVLSHAEAACAEGQPLLVLPHLVSLTECCPLNERAHAALMIALAAAGRQADALDVFSRLRQRLDEQLGVLPGPVLTAAHTRQMPRRWRPSWRPAGPRLTPAPLRCQWTGHSRRVSRSVSCHRWSLTSPAGPMRLPSCQSGWSPTAAT
jgi:DNA-binding SARP family transcriptional activator